ncbi:cytochrome c [Bradyrhizobium liaoningense]|uniref:c-type cytochrome n=1 Tax=Bradyrhizobium liaoningense TaxID=43992 RepID=UPI001BA9EB84|nr:cytochrome c [Bradyrhizobium liaoningense]MBR0816614.1 cytochrome c [Bradyrhizobium liaoningense]
MPNWIGLALLIVSFLLLLGLLCIVGKIRSGVLRWGAAGALGLLLMLTSLLSGAVIAGLIKQHGRGRNLPTPAVAIDAGQASRGEAISNSFCADCHSRTGTLTGGKDFAAEIPVPIGSFIPSNLTPAGALSRWSDGEIFRAIRNSVDAKGRWLMIMSYTSANMLSDSDIEAVIAYLRSLPRDGAPSPEPPDRFNLLGLAMLGAGLLPGGKPILTGVIMSPPPGTTAQYGEYLVSYLDCRGCHGRDLTGGVPGQMTPLGPDLTVMKSWSLHDFIATMRTGSDPSGNKLSRQMPWRSIGHLSDDGLIAMYSYVTNVIPGR